MQQISLSDIEVAQEMADAAREVILPFFRKPDLETSNKLADGFDPVTVADRAAEQAMRAVLARHRPDDGIFGEEYGQVEGLSGRTWVLDPIDGTRGFISGTPTWGVLIALSTQDGPVMGVIDQPYIGERFIGSVDTAEVSGPTGTQPLKTRATETLDQAVLFTTFPEVGTSQERAGFESVAQHVRLTRYGMDCYAYALLAAGQVDLVIECGLNAYDIQAPIAVIEAAGGIVTDWQGGPAHQGGRVLAAANADLHAKALAILHNV
ncbi:MULTISPECIES: histidinol-phosphatase [unclassified Ruegeria]|uniref:histidinol-phosphatase n=1 Tax=unclassified Ruegeria TaxID=2625375 RepID=UPI001ADC9F4A|nr:MULTISPECIES: histidinol-phosphatase [unclassified Ruegeria]MBO9411195.1 histidinol-phosphatase [Ruegeria sp. R8_1]MBO9415396.1 histidinol-phosphatase [Ruegeria sp. R8_2]